MKSVVISRPSALALCGAALSTLLAAGHARDARAHALTGGLEPAQAKGPCASADKVSAVDLTVAPSQPLPGDGVAITFRFTATCPAPAAWRITAGEKVIGSGTKDVPRAGVVTVMATWLAVQGDTKIVASVDPANLLGESDAARANNALAHDVHVAGAAPAPEPSPSPPPTVSPTPPPPPGPSGQRGGANGTCSAWERRVGSKGEGLITVEPARATPSGHDYAECVRRLVGAVPQAFCSPAERKALAKKTWFSQAGEQVPVQRTAECR